MKVKHLLVGLCAVIYGGIFSNSVSATTYSRDVEVKFTFNSEIQIDIDTADIEILDLTPGQQKDSNIVNVSVSTNNVAGYTVSATTGNTTYNNTDMTHSDGVNKFTSISTDASESTLSTDNTWGYSTSMDSGTSWANFSGLPIYTDTAKEIAKTDGPSTDLTKFKIHAKASTSQPAGNYRNVITFNVVANVPPRTFDDVIPTKTMQAMNESVCDLVEVYDEESQTQLTDTRDGNEYWVAKLKDNHCWMTQNLDLDLARSKPLTSENTDLNEISTEQGDYYYDGYTKNVSTDVITWTPAVDTFSWSGSGWDNGSTSFDDYYSPRSYNAGDYYQVGTIFSSTTCNYLTNYDNCTNYFKKTEDSVNGSHGHVGNYYNFPAAVASNNTSKYIDSHENTLLNPQNSICPAGWRLPKTKSYDQNSVGVNELWNLAYYYNNKNTNNDDGLLIAPLYFVRGGYMSRYSSNNLNSPAYYGYYLSSTVYGSVYTMYHYSWGVYPFNSNSNNYGYSMRCLAKYSNHLSINFDANGGTGVMASQSINSGSTASIRSNQFTWEGKAFTGWNTEPDGSGTSYSNAGNYTAPTLEADSTTTLYAQWKRTGSFSINYDKNDPDATGETPTQQIPYGDTDTISGNSFSKDDSDFYVWNTEPDGQGVSYAGDQDFSVDNLEPTDDITLYAIWLDDDNPNKPHVTIPTANTGITLQRAYEIAYTGAHKGMYEEIEEGKGKYRRVNIWGDEQYQGFDTRFSMQDMTANICKSVTVANDDLIVLDDRDDKLYHITKLLDGKCWMTQNLDHDIVTTEGYYTHANTDLGWGADKNTTTWTPTRATISAESISGGVIPGWALDVDTPYSVDTGDWYWSGSASSSSCNYLTAVCADFSNSSSTFTNGTHGHVGNYYNWASAVASNDTSSFSIDTYDNILGNPQNSICPAGWRLPTIYDSDKDRRNEFRYLLDRYNAYDSSCSSTSNCDTSMVPGPLWFVRGGLIQMGNPADTGALDNPGGSLSYWSSTVKSAGTWSPKGAYYLLGTPNIANPANYQGGRYYGRSIRCVAR